MYTVGHNVSYSQKCINIYLYLDHFSCVIQGYFNKNTIGVTWSVAELFPTIQSESNKPSQITNSNSSQNTTNNNTINSTNNSTSINSINSPKENLSGIPSTKCDEINTATTTTVPASKPPTVVCTIPVSNRDCKYNLIQYYYYYSCNTVELAVVVEEYIIKDEAVSTS